MPSSFLRALGATGATVLLVLAAPTALAATSVPAPQPSYWGGSLCDSVAEERRSLCVAMEARNCLLANDDSSFWTCHGLLHGNCGLMGDPGDFWLCYGLTNSNCGVVGDPGAYNLCQAVVRGDCRGLDQQGFAWCSVIVGAVPVNRS